MMNVFDYPLILLQELEVTYGTIRNVAAKNNDLIKMILDEPFNIKIEGNDPKVYFIFGPAKIDSSGKILITITYFPISRGHHAEAAATVPTSSSIEMLNSWIKVLRGYASLKLSPDEKIIKEYEEEFYQDLKILDEDADIKPFKLPQQLFLLKYLEYVETVLDKEEKQGVDVTEIKNETTSLKEDLQNLSQNGTMKKISQILAKTRKKGLTVVGKVWDEALKEIIKKGVTYTIENHHMIVQKLEAFFLP